MHIKYKQSILLNTKPVKSIYEITSIKYKKEKKFN